jgi:tRNA(Ile2) C34 agmatinyltransferase TiaS
MSIPEPRDQLPCPCGRCDDNAPACPTCGMEMAGHPIAGWTCPDCDQEEP